MLVFGDFIMTNFIEYFKYLLFKLMFKTFGYSRKVTYNVASTGLIEINIYINSEWEDFDEIINFLIKSNNINVVSIDDGDFYRDAILSLDGHKFKLTHDDLFGNVLSGEGHSSRRILRKMYYDLKKHFK